MDPRSLVAAFDAFEGRTRGSEVWDHRVELEPAFMPILPAARARAGRIDDGRKPGVWERLRRLYAPPADVAEFLPKQPGARSDEPRDIADLTLLAPHTLVVKSEVAQRLLTSLGTVGGRAAFEVIGTPESTWIQLACDEAKKQHVSGSVLAYFPEIKVRERPAALAEAWQEAGDHCAVVHLAIADRIFKQLRNEPRFEVDPLVEVVARLDDLRDAELGLVQVLFEPSRAAWGEELLAFVKSIDDADRVLPLIERKFSEPTFSVALRVATLSDDPERCVELARRLAAGLHAITKSAENELTLVSPGNHDVDSEALDVLDRETRRSGMILTLSELATLVHVPSAAVRSRRLLRQSARTKAAPLITRDHALVLGLNEHDGDTEIVSLSPEQRLRHLYAIGASGTGKSTLLLSMAAQDIALGNGFAVLDPHGDLVEDILSRIPEERAGDVVLLDPADEEFPIGFNILSAHSELERTLLASDLVAVFKRLSTSFGDVMVSVLGNAVLAFLESSQGGTLLDLRNFLVDADFRAEIVKTVRDEEVISYWRREFTLLKGVPHAPVLTRLNTFLRPKLIRRMVAQKANRLDFRRLMDEKKIVLAKLSHGAIGEENAHLLGSLLVAKIAQAAMSRQNIEAAKREPYVCYIDEFHHFVTPSIASILSGARKYGLGLVLAHQEMRQLRARSEEVASAVLANAGTRAVFRVGEQDAKALAEGFSSFEPKDLQSLGVGEAIARVERADFDFNLRTQRLEPVEPDDAASRRAAVVSASRAAYATPRDVVDAEITQVTEALDAESPPRPSEQPAKRTSRQKGPSRTQEPPDLPGRGGSRHKYLQQLVARQAKERGFEISFEKSVLDGYGYVDAVLTGHGITVACEISVTTTIEHEVGNLTKCLAAGFDRVVFISSDETNRDLARAEMAGPGADRVHILSPGEVPALLDQLSAATPTRAKRKHGGGEGSQTPTPASDNAFLTTEQAARYVGLAKQTLAEMRVKGNGPPFHKPSRRVIYKRSELDAWLAERRRRSTSEKPGEEPEN